LKNYNNFIFPKKLLKKKKYIENTFFHYPNISKFYTSIKYTDEFDMIAQFDIKVFVVLVLGVKNKITN